MQVSPLLLAEIYSQLEHGEITGISRQLGQLRTKVNRELITLKEDYDEAIINTAIKRIEARGIILLHKETLVS